MGLEAFISNKCPDNAKAETTPRSKGLELVLGKLLFYFPNKFNATNLGTAKGQTIRNIHSPLLWLLVICSPVLLQILVFVSVWLVIFHKTANRSEQ